MNASQLQAGDTVYWVTGRVSATVISVADYGDVVIDAAGHRLPITTRACYLRPCT